MEAIVAGLSAGRYQPGQLACLPLPFKGLLKAPFKGLLKALKHVAVGRAGFRPWER